MAIAAACIGALLLGACGQRGPLYLPQSPAAKPAAEKPVDTTPRATPTVPSPR
ncbi:lipoprotein [Hydrogenophaga sp.]|uniref:LPS translocon maturation chaperone LptM n=1 Tax=Hydrogenophaga sp. TaxID=1904254 RepID=UPI002722D374|nr:lipoprotein [Hydrogenophaga sp.]MDO9436178.1 lipoprotein [Hydrogenophaga sp.]